MSRTGALFAAFLGATAFLGSGTAESAESLIAEEALSGLLPLPSARLDGLRGGPLIFTDAQSTDGGSATATVSAGPGGTVAIRSSVSVNGSVAGAPITLERGAIVTGDLGNVAMENSGGITALQLSTGLGNVQQNAVSFVFVLSGLPQ